ncbi:MAG: hypothetical protein K2Y21_12005 [Phycisphaerales bacterium]|nr:hypothetical protein [Phycisphaerales bacterium]
MPTPISRRDVLLTTGSAILLAPLAARAEPAAAPTGPWPHFPHDDPKLIAEVVGKSHFDEARVKELVTTHPHLANAWWDWGFGDWESPLGAASHTGRRGIAEFLIERGARIDIFAAAMLGYTDVVKSFITARPGIQRQLGPHGIPLLAHAKAGGDAAKDTFDYLKSLGDAGNAPAAKPITPEEQQHFVGVYTLDTSTFEIKVNNNKALVFTMDGESDRLIYSLSNAEFFPAGVPTTKLAFDLSANPVTVTITAGPLTRRAIKQ